MLLSAAILLRELSARYACTLLRSVPEGLCVSRPQFYRAGMELTRGACYLLTSDDPAERFPAVQLPLLLIAVGDAARMLKGAFCPVAELPTGTDALLVANELHAVFDRYDAWLARMRGAAGGGALAELLSAAAETLLNPLALLASDGSVLARVAPPPVPGEGACSDISYETLERLKTDSRFQGFAQLENCYVFREPASGARFLCANAHFGEEPACRLLAQDLACDFSPGDAFLLEQAAACVRDLMRERLDLRRAPLSDARQFRAESLLRRAISNEKVDYIPVINGLAELDWLPKHSYCCVAVRISTFEHQTHSVKLICNQFESLLPESCAFEHEGAAVLIVNLTRFGGDVDDVIGKLVYFVRDHYLKAGVSGAFSGISDMYYYYKQACIALEYVCRPQSFRWILRFSDIALHYLVEQSVRELPTHIVCAQGVLAMRAYDEEHGTDFYRTLECYVNNRFNALQSAKALYIHRSTFLYRLDRIKELFHIDPENDESFPYVLFSMQMLALTRSHKPELG